MNFLCPIAEIALGVEFVFLVTNLYDFPVLFSLEWTERDLC